MRRIEQRINKQPFQCLCILWHHFLRWNLCLLSKVIKSKSYLVVCTMESRVVSLQFYEEWLEIQTNMNVIQVYSTAVQRW